MQLDLPENTSLTSWHLSKNELTACQRKNVPRCASCSLLLITGAGWGNGSRDDAAIAKESYSEPAKHTQDPRRTMYEQSFAPHFSVLLQHSISRAGEFKG